MNHREKNRRQHGFSLVELMVAMVVSLILLAGILQILLGNRQSFEAQKAMAGLQQNARLASFVIENAVAHAGYRVKLRPKLKRVFPNGFIVGIEGGGTSPDSIRIRFEAAGGLSDCGGTQVGDNNTLVVANFVLSIDPQNELQCVVFDDAGNVVSTWALISNVETLQIRYGLDTNENDAIEAVDTYTSGLTTAQKPQVRSVRVQLLLVSQNNVLPAPTDQTFTFADGQTMTFDNTRRARQMVDQTIALRNLLP